MIILVLALLACMATCIITVYSVISDEDYYYSKITCHHCHNLHHYQLNSTIHFTSNTQFLFFPGLHRLYSDLIIENVHNISFISKKINTSVIISCNSSVGLVLRNITSLVIENIIIRNCHTQLFSSYGYPAVVITECKYVKLNHVKIYHNMQKNLTRTSFLGLNIMGNSSLDYLTCAECLYLYYYETNMTWPIKNHILSLNHYNSEDDLIVNNEIHVTLNQFSYALTLQVTNTVTRDAFLHMVSRAVKYNKLVITNCHFIIYHSGNKLRFDNVSILYFKNCQFVNYSNYEHYNYITLQGSNKVTFSHCVFHDIYFIRPTCLLSNVVIEHCQFNHNFDYISMYDCKYNSQLQLATFIIKNTSFNTVRTPELYLMSLVHTKLLLIGPVRFIGIIIHRSIDNAERLYIIKMLNCTITIYGYVEFSHNTVTTLIEFVCVTKECFTINVAKNASLVITDNTLATYFHAEWPNVHSFHTSKYVPCFFQYLIDDQNDCVNYSIVFNRNKFDIIEMFWMLSMNMATILSEVTTASYAFPSLTHCHWLPHSAFNHAIPLDINNRYIKSTNNSKELLEIVPRKLLCYCSNDTHYDCYKDDLGYLYPGQTAAVSFCYPTADEYVDNAEFRVIVDTSANQTYNTPCMVYKANETSPLMINSKNCTRFYYTIAFPTDSWCELFLKVPYGKRMKYSVFYVRQLLCPLGFIKENGICQCYPLFKQFGISNCDINKQAVLRPANSWIYASNYNHYVISEQCPCHYCRENAFYLNLSTPEVQCQYNRSGLLCGQCRHGLSAVFGFPHCQYCSNIHLLLIIPIAIAGFLLVVVLFILNFTVTDGTINAFILYVNIISVNDTVFFPSHNSYQNTILYAFISLANLDLGIKTCFYSGMDDYAKMWLQLGFPFYLIFIAALLIITSRYSNIIQRLTAHRALPVLATLFLLSYTKILRTVCNVLFLYSLVTYLPSKQTKLLWSVDANVPLFGIQFTLLFIVCLILFLILVPFNVILLFTRTLSKFNFINKFKPLLDAYQGPYKFKFYYWTGLQLVMRTVFFGLSSLSSSDINLSASIIILSIFNVVHAYSKPFKSKAKNYQEFFLIINLLGLYIFALSSVSNDINVTAINIMITLAVAQFSLIVLYHILTYGCSGVVTQWLLSLYHDVLAGKFIRSNKKLQTQQFDLHHCNIPDVTYNYHEYQEPLIGQEYCQ